MKEVKKVVRIPDESSLKEACTNGRLQAIGKIVVGWKVTIYTDGTEDKEEINYMVHARDVLDKEEMSLFRKGIKAIVECRTQEGVETLLTLFGVATDNVEQAERYLDRFFPPMPSLKPRILTRADIYKEDTVVPILQMAARNEFPTTRFIRKPRERKKYTKEELAFLL